MIGQTISHYRVLEKLGQGGMGVVYLAEDTRLGRRVALKALTPELARDPQSRKRFQQEARAAASIAHPGIAAVYEMEEVGEDLYIVYEYVRGESLRTQVKSSGLDLDTLLDIALNIAQALVAAHELGVVHRDLKPENILRTPGGDTKILDFGLARFQPSALDQETRSIGLTQAGSIVGTVAYMSPEQLESKEADFRSDIFSFGVLLYELATGAHPFEGGSAASTIARIMTAEARPLVERNPLTPPELDRIVRKCLRKRREERYQSTRDLAVDLESLRRDSAWHPAGDMAATEAIPAPAPGGDHDSLLRAMASRVGFTPRRWWELHQLFVIFLYTPAALHVGLNGSAMLSHSLNVGLASTGSDWQGLVQVIKPESGGPFTIWRNFGLVIFLSFVLLLITSAMIRLYTLCLAAFVPDRLPPEIRRFQMVLVSAYAIVACQLAFIGLYLLRSTGELVWGVGLVAFGLVTLLAAVYVEPVMVRAAFPEAFAQRESAEARTLRTKYRYIAGIHFAFLLLLFLPVASGKVSLNFIFSESLGKGFSLLQVLGLLYGCVLLVGGTALLVNAVESWRGNLSILRHFRQFPALYLFLDLVGIVAWVLAGTPLPVAISVAVILLYLPRAQYRLAREILTASGEHVLEKPQATAVPRDFRLMAAIQAVYLSIPLIFLVRFVGIQGMEEEFFRSLWHTTGGQFFALAVFPVLLLCALFLLSITIWRLWRGDEPAVRLFLRWFPLYLLFDFLVLPLAMLFAMKYAGLLAAWVILPFLAYLPFYQRQLARKILDRAPSS